MSSEIEIGHLAFLYPWAGGEAESQPFDFIPRPFGPDDRVVTTAGDRPVEDSLPLLRDPAADFEDKHVARRRVDVDEKHRRIIEYLDIVGMDAVLLRRADSVAWFTAGADLAKTIGSEVAEVNLLVSRNYRAVLTDNVLTARVFEEELAGLGFQVKERAWHDDPSLALKQITHGKKVVSDAPSEGIAGDLERIKALRNPMTPLERQWLRELGRALTLTVEATCRNFMPGETEADVAGHLAHRLIREGIAPIDIRVAADDRLERYRSPHFKSAQIRERAVISAVGRRHGLCAAVTRTVTFGKPKPVHAQSHEIAAMVDATCIFFSRPGRPVNEVFQRAFRIYEKFDRADEWMLDYQGFQIGYLPREAILHPRSTVKLPSNTALCWSPTVGASRSEDTVAIDQRGFEVVTEAQNWPKIEVSVKGYPIPRPGILER